MVNFFQTFTKKNPWCFTKNLHKSYFSNLQKSQSSTLVTFCIILPNSFPRLLTFLHPKIHLQNKPPKVSQEIFPLYNKISLRHSLWSSLKHFQKLNKNEGCRLCLQTLLNWKASFDFNFFENSSIGSFLQQDISPGNKARREFLCLLPISAF